MSEHPWPNIRDIWAARKTIAGFITKSPLIKSPLLSEQLDASIYLKLETAQEIGAYKVRGAANKIQSLTSEEKRRGVVTFSTGNHGIAVSYIAGKINIRAVVCVSQRVPEAKVNILRRLGAEVKVVGQNQDEAEEFCYKIAEEDGLTVIQPFDDPYVIAGQGTIGLELLEDCPNLDTILIPLSGGGIILRNSLSYEILRS